MKFKPLLVALALAAALSTPLIAQAQCYNAAGAPIKCREDREKKQASATATLVPSPTPVPSPTSTVPPVSDLGVGIPPAPDAPAAQGSDGGGATPDGTTRGNLPPLWMLAGVLALAIGVLGGVVLLFRRARSGDDGSAATNVDFYFNPKEIDIDKPEPFAKHQTEDDAPTGRAFAKWSPNFGGQAPADGDLGAVDPPEPDFGAVNPPEPDKTHGLPDQHLSSLPDQHLSSLPDQHLSNVPPPDADKPGALPEPHM